MLPRRKLFSFGITHKVIFIVVISVGLSIGLATLFNYLSLTRRLSQTSGEELHVVAQGARDVVESDIENTTNFLELIAHSPVVREDLLNANRAYDALSPEAREAGKAALDEAWKKQESVLDPFIDTIESTENSDLLKAVKMIDPQDVEIMLTDRHGYIVAMTNRTTDYWQADEDWWQKSLQSSVYISPPTYDGSSQVWAIHIALPIYDLENTQQLNGVVRGTIDIASIMDSVFSIQFGKSGKGYFISSDGFAYNLSQGHPLTIRKVSPNRMTAIEQNAGQWTTQFPDFSGNISIAGVEKIFYQQELIGWVLVLMEEQELHLTILSAMQENLSLAIVLILAMGITGSLISNRFLEAFRVLKKEFHRIAEGDYSYSFSKSVANSSDTDIKGLVDSFSRMSLAVQSREKTIQESEKKYRHLVETMNEGLVMIDEQGRIEFTNPRFLDMSGFKKEELIGKSFLMVFAPDERENVALHWTSRILGIQSSYETELLRKSGDTLSVLISPQRLSNEQDEFLGSLAVITDISAGKKVEITQQKKIKELASLRQVDISILSSTKLENVIQTVFDQLQSQLAVDAASIHIFDPQSSKLRISSGFFQGTMVRCKKSDIHSDRLNLLVNDKKVETVLEDISRKVIWKKLEDQGMKILYRCPILVASELKGIMEIAYCKPVTLDTDWMSYFDALVTQTSVGIEKVELFDKLQTRNRDLQEAYVSAIKGWAKALELRDEETKGHSDRVVEMAVKMAVEYGYKGEDLENFRNGAFLHDIGKMGVPDGILLKPGTLTEEEWVLMRKHPVFAYQLLKEIPFLKNAYEIPYYHHERWNGSGYPHGLKGEDIPLSARIFAVVDVWDALSNDRPYRKAWKPEEVKKYIEDNKEIQFDPQIVETFFKLFRVDGSS